MKLFFGLILCSSFIFFGCICRYFDKIEARFFPPPKVSELIQITAKGPFKADMETRAGRIKTRFFWLYLPDWKRIKIQEPKLDKIAVAVSSARQLTYHLSPEENKHHRQLWKMTETSSSGNVTTILLYEDCIKSERGRGLLLHLAGVFIIAFGIAGAVALILGLEDYSLKAHAVGWLALMGAAVFVFAFEKDDVRMLFRKGAEVEIASHSPDQHRARPFSRVLVDDKGRSLAVTILKIDDGMVKIRRTSDNTEFTIPFDKLSEKDREFLRGY